VVAAVAVVLLAVWSGNVALLIVIGAIVAMVMVHELGHYTAARLSGMKVTEYFFGFGPRLWSVRRGEIEYGVKAVPLGGYVKIIGMTNMEAVDPEDEARAYRQQSFPRRMAVAVAGSTMHFVVAFLMFWAFLVLVGVPSSHGASVAGFASIRNAGDPARAAGVKPGDQILSIDGHHVASIADAASLIRSRAGRLLTVGLERGGHAFTVKVRAASVPVSEVAPVGKGASKAPAKSIGMIGVELATPMVRVGVLPAIVRSGVDLGRLTQEMVAGLARNFSLHGLSSFVHDLVSQKAAARAAKSQSTSRPLSIYGAVHLATQAASAGAGNLLLMLIEIFVALGLINLFPMYPLDGGHVAVAVYERLRSRRGRRYHADVAKLAPVMYAFLAFLVFLSIGALYLDITHPIANPFG
jgi:membrane-associated protease RseP (regulator of RpoE activity)